MKHVHHENKIGLKKLDILNKSQKQNENKMIKRGGREGTERAFHSMPFKCTHASLTIVL